MLQSERVGEGVDEKSGTIYRITRAAFYSSSESESSSPLETGSWACGRSTAVTD